MQIFQNISKLTEMLLVLQQQSQKIGFVPTMGALHQGHLALIKQAKAENDIVVCSIYVNPTQFNNPDDLAKYPRILDADAEMLRSVGCDILFAPIDAEMYPEPAKIKFDFGFLETTMEGKFRPGHFNGVALVVSKLFHIVMPHKAYFGQKDLQQYLVIKQLTSDLSFPIEIVRCQIVREENGLAMSSRNKRLSTEQIQIASNIYKALQMAEKMLNTHSLEQIQEQVQIFFAQIEGIELEYFEIADAQTLENIPNLQKHSKAKALCVAAFVGEVRLIDNLWVDA
ncbi:pantoate--beta-alanine ligase [bacterium 336/3]|nr:pantoate--beta-alanine ligase [bacterium 336/3]